MILLLPGIPLTIPFGLSSCSIEPAVLFTADSGLEFSQRTPWNDGMVITAPHHGSENNAKACVRFANETHNGINVTWVVVTDDSRIGATGVKGLGLASYVLALDCTALSHFYTRTHLSLFYDIG